MGEPPIKTILQIENTVCLKITPGESLPYAPATKTPTMSTHTMTGAVNLSSNRNSILTTMAISRPLRGERGGQEGMKQIKKANEERIQIKY